MANPEEQIERTTEAFKSFAEGGQHWVSLEDVALRAMTQERNRRRYKHSRAVNSIRDMLSLDSTPTKPPLRYRRRTARAIETMEEEGRVEQRTVCNDVELYQGLSGEAQEYRLIPAADQGQSSAFRPARVRPDPFEPRLM